MRIVALVAVLIAAASAALAAPPITVTGHAWAPFISPMGEPYRARSIGDDTLARWFARADRDRNGALTAAEMQSDAERFFATLDSDHDGEIDPDELATYEYEIAPDIQVLSRSMPAPGEPRPKRSRRGDAIDDSALALRGGLQGAARYGLLNMPEPVAAADTDFDRGISLGEFRQAAAARFGLLDRSRSGRLTLPELQALRETVATGRSTKRRDSVDARVGNPLPADPAKLD